MKPVLRPAIVLVILSALCFTASAWSQPQRSEEEWKKLTGDVSGQQYERRVKEIRDQLADTFPLMALVEIRIIELLLDASADLGFFYELVSKGPNQEGEIGFLKESSMDFRALAAQDPGLRMMGTLGRTAEAQINAAIESLASQRKVTVWAEPSILTLMGHTASIESGDQVPYMRRVVVGNTETISTSFRPTGVSLSVLPNVVDHDGTQFVNLYISASVSNVTRFREEEGFEQPITDTRQYESVIEITSGQYVVLGGIYRSVASSSRRGIPGLMNMPLIGWMARGSSEGSSQSELVILIRPQIVNLEQTGKVDLETLRSSPDEEHRFLRGGEENRHDLLPQSAGKNTGSER
jgi:type II secretory pathway component GspD/PulD (secretin)